MSDISDYDPEGDNNEWLDEDSMGEIDEDFVPGQDEGDEDDDDEDVFDLDTDLNPEELVDFQALIARDNEDSEDGEPTGNMTGRRQRRMPGSLPGLAEDEDEAGTGEAANPVDVIRTQLAEFLNTAGEGSDGTILLPHAFFRTLFASGLLPSDVVERLSAQIEEDVDEDDMDEDDEDGSDEEEEDDDDDEQDYRMFRRPIASSRTMRNGRLKGWHWFTIEREGKEEGRKLARGGEFGRVGFPKGDEMRTETRTKKELGIVDLDDDVVIEEDEEEMDSDDEEAQQPSRTFNSSPINISPSSRTKRRPSLSPRASLCSARRLSTGGSNKKRRQSSFSSLASAIAGVEDDGKEKGIKREIKGRGAWGVGVKGFGREGGRGVWGSSGREEWSKKCLPNTNGTIVATYNAYPYIGQHSHDYSFFYTATQAFQLHMYSTQEAPRSRPTPNPNPAPRRPRRNMYSRGYLEEDIEEDHSMRKIKTVQGVEGQWTVTDADLSRDNEWMIYSSITSRVHLLRTAEHEDEHTMLDFSQGAGGSRSRWGRGDFGIWSIRFSADQKEIVAGAGSGQIMVYDIEQKQRILNIGAHQDDVNGVCFADENSTNVIVSASDDGFLKVWDRRSIGSSVPSGVLVGHTQGITFVDPKGDGRYVISNGKDQAIRLWDLRKMRGWNEVAGSGRDAAVEYGIPDWDYRADYYKKPRYTAHPLDCSVMTYRGHHVLRTLIRCHFSPESTGGQYIYTGGSNGIIWIYHIDGRVVQVLDRTKAEPLVNAETGGYNDPSAPAPVVAEYDPDPRGMVGMAVRDVSWNGNEPSLISTAWARNGGGDIAMHQWKGLGKGGLNRLEDWVEMNEANGAAED